MGCCFSKQKESNNIYEEFIKYEQVEFEFNNNFKVIDNITLTPVNIL